MTNFLPARIDQLKLNYENLSSVNSKLIYASV